MTFFSYQPPVTGYPPKLLLTPPPNQTSYLQVTLSAVLVSKIWTMLILIRLAWVKC